MRLGFISEKYESGGRGPGTISKISDDPGGKSYGTYQLSASTLHEYVEQSVFEFKEALFSKEFDRQWTYIGENFKGEFELEQHLFLTRRNYLPVVIYARTLGYDTWSRRMQEAIFSMSMQHGGVLKILNRAFVSNATVEAQLELLYDARLEYVRSLQSLSPRLKDALERRYVLELQDVLRIQEKDYESVQ